MGIFNKLRAARMLQKKTLPFLETVLDWDIIIEVGGAQESQQLLGISGLFAADIGASATISRRLTRLKELGVVRERRVIDDKRKRALVLHPSISRRLNNLVRLWLKS